MAHLLQQLLKDDNPVFLSTLEKLEKTVGGESVDVRLIADITHKAHEVLRVMKLDPAGSTALEVYHSLRNYVSENVPSTALQHTGFVLFIFEDEVISFNEADLKADVMRKASFEERALSNAHEKLREEIVRRYTNHPLTHDETVQKLLREALLLPQEKPEEKMEKNTILAIGDIFTDAFIKLNEDVARVETDEKGEKRISLPLGSKPPYDGVDIVQGVGPGPNAAVATARIGVKTGLVSFLGSDQVGKDAIEYLKNETIDTTAISMQEGLKTSYYYVLRYGAERTILVKNEAFEYKWVDPAVEPEWIFLALMSPDSWQFHLDLLAYLEAHPNVKFAFQPGTFHFKWGVEKLAGFYKRTHIIVLNREEAVDITGESYDSIRNLANALHELGPQKVVITDGPNGSYASYDYKLVTIPNYPDPAPPVDRTGAGDAFASTIVAALASGETMDTGLTWAPINSASVVQKIGAQAGLLSKSEIISFLENAPDWYKLTDFEG